MISLLMEEVRGVLVMILLKVSGVDNSPSSHSDNHTNIFLVLDKDPAYDINSSSSSSKKVSINSNKANTKFGLCLLSNHDNSYSF